MEDTKVCFKCHRELPISSFYKHPKMHDGHLNKCKDCTKIDVKNNYSVKSQDELWMEKERVRGREKYERLHYRSKKTEHTILKKQKYPQARGQRENSK